MKNVDRFPRIVGEVEKLGQMLRERDIPVPEGISALGQVPEKWMDVVTEAFRYEERRGEALRDGSGG